MSESIECVVIGAGVVGLAIARELANSGLETIVLESEERIGAGISSRNSEVVHAGIYYACNSLKAELCVAGRQLLYDYCKKHHVDHEKTGKLIVATSQSQLAKLRTILEAGRNNGVTDLLLLDAAAAAQIEPELRCVAAISSPSTGIVDSHGLMLAFQADLEAASGAVVFRAPVIGGRFAGGRIYLDVGDSQETEIECRYVVNSAGLSARAIAAAFDGLQPDSLPEIRYAKGNYFSLGMRSPFRRLIYPVPEPGGLGVHLTLDLNGRARFGPDVEWVSTIDYSVDPSRASRFYDAIRRYWPALPDDALSPDYAGIRPKLGGESNREADFVVQGPEAHGVPGMINLYGIESPGLTASLAIAIRVRRLLLGR